MYGLTMVKSNSLWGQINNSLNSNKGIAYSMGLTGLIGGIGAIMGANALKSSIRSTMGQIKANADYEGNEVAKLMSNNALSYLKNGVGISGSALEVIRQNQENGLKAIRNELQYSRRQAIDNINQIRNQAILGLGNTIANWGMLWGRME